MRWLFDCFGPPMFSDVLLTLAETWHEEIRDFVCKVIVFWVSSFLGQT